MTEMRTVGERRLRGGMLLCGLVVSVGVVASACSSSGTPSTASGTTTVDSPVQLVSSGLAALKAGRVETARTDFNEVLTIDPKDLYGVNKVAHFDLGVIDQQKSMTTASEAEYEAALKLDPDYAPALYNLGVEVAVRDPLKAITLYRQVVAIQPTDVAAMYNLGLLLYQNGQVTEGQSLLTKVLSLDPAYRKILPANVTP